VLALAGCGSSSKSRDVTVPAYGDHPAATVAAGTADPAACRIDADAFAHAGRLFLAHSAARAAYPADLFFVQLREALADFRARGCNPAILRSRLGPRQREALIEGLPASLSTALRGL
jgi:hypothetical protein